MFSKKINTQQAVIFAVLGVVASALLPATINPASFVQKAVAKLKGGAV